MANLKQCDVCKKISPNDKGEHIANGWLEIAVSDCASRSNHRRPDQHLVCDDCFERGVTISIKGVQTND